MKLLLILSHYISISSVHKRNEPHFLILSEAHWGIFPSIVLSLCKHIGHISNSAMHAEHKRKSRTIEGYVSRDDRGDELCVVHCLNQCGLLLPSIFQFPPSTRTQQHHQIQLLMSNVSGK